MPLFFVISGFCIHLKWASSAPASTAAVRFIPFWRRRLHRLYPPYFVMLCLSMSLILVAHFRGVNVPLVTGYPQPTLAWMGGDFVVHALMLHGLHPLFDKMGGNPVYWTLAREEYFYLLYFPLLAMRRRLGLPTAVTVVAGVSAGAQALADAVPAGWQDLVRTSAPALWAQWALGMVAAESYCGRVALPKWCSSGWTVVGFGVLVGCAPVSLGCLDGVTTGLLFFFLVNWCVRRERAGLWPDARAVNWLSNVGVFSYSLYLVHNPVRAVVERLLGDWANTPSPVVYVLAAGLMAAAGYLAGVVFFRVVERRFLNPRSPRPGSEA